jgi:replicative DNA helicase
MFTEPYLKTIVGVMKEYYAKYDVTASYDIISIKLRDRCFTTDDVQYYDEAMDKLKGITTEGIEEIEDMAEKFFKQQNWVRVANEIKRIAGDGDMSKYDECQRLIEQANAIGRKTEESTSPLDNVEEDLSKESVITIPTGIDKLDATLGGGLDKGKIGLLMGPTSFGKALIINELCATPKGFVEAKDIKVGDKLIGCDGKPTTVLGVFPQGIRPIYRVKFSDGSYYDCDENHILPVNTYYQRSGKKYVPGVSKNAKDKVYAPDRTFKNLTLREIMDKGLYRNGGRRFNFATPVCKPVEFEERETKVSPYLIGVLIGDGCLPNKSFCFGVSDSQIKENALIGIPKEQYSIRCNKEGLNEAYLFKNVWNDVEKVIDTTCKPETKYIPELYLYNSIEKRIELLQGLMDTDGFVSKEGYCMYNTKSFKLANDFLTLVRSLGGVASIHEKDACYKDSNGNKVDCGIQYEISFGLFDENIKVSSLDRKQNRVKYHTSKKFHKFIESVEYLGEYEAVCFYVDADDHLFLVRDFNVTHNTSMTTGISAYAAAYKCAANDYRGYKILQIVFEDSPRDIHRKYFSRLSQVETSKINENEETTQKVRDILKNHPDREYIKNNIQVLQLATGDYSASDIKRVIKKKINEGFKPDMVVIDYFECINAEKGMSNLQKWEQETKTMRKFETMAKELNIAIWIPTQGNRGSVTSELVTMDQGAGAFTKQQIAQVVISIARSVDDIKNQKATLAVLKNRSGSAGIVLNGITFNNGTCTIVSDDATDFDSVLAYEEYSDNQRTATKFDGYM